MVTDEERALIKQAWSTGPGPLVEKGMSTNEIRTFFSRVDVKAEVALLDAELKHTKTLDVRVKFVARRNIARLIDGAGAVLARSLMGRQYARHPETGVILTDAKGIPLIEEEAPTQNQLRAAGLVFDAVGVTDPKLVADRAAGEVQPLTLLESAEGTFEIETDPDYVDEEQRALSRERTRTTIDQLLSKLPAIRERVFDSLEGGGTTKSSKRKVSRKKTTRKVKTNGRAKKKL